MEQQLLLIDIKQAAKLLSISARHLANLRKAGTIPFVPLGGRIMYDPQALRRWISEQGQQGKAS